MRSRDVAFVFVGAGFPDRTPMKTASAMFDLREVPAGQVAVEASPDRSYDAGEVLSALSKARPAGALAVGVADLSLSMKGGVYVTGVNDPSRGVAAVSLMELKRAADPRTLRERLLKQIAHEVGDLVGLGHCSNPLCIMAFSEDPSQLDAKLPTLCADCGARLASR